MRRLAAALLVAGLLAGCDKPPPAPPAPPTLDPFTFLNAPGVVVIGSGARVGLWGERRTKAGGQDLVECTSIVGETPESWLVESDSPAVAAMTASFPDLRGVLLGLTVRKSDGVVTRAIAASPGQVGRTIAIAPVPGAVPTAAPAATTEACATSIGTFDAKRYEFGGTTSWVGIAGATKDRLVKVDGPDGYELGELPRDVTLDLNGTPVQACLTRYTNGMSVWTTQDPVITAVFGAAGAEGAPAQAMLKTLTKDFSLEVTAFGADAKPRLVW